MTVPERDAVPDAVQLSDRVLEALYFQTYGRERKIDGVSIQPLRKHRAENGWFAELLRVTDGSIEAGRGEGDGMALRQVSVSHAAPGRINAFHIHPRIPQNELWMVIQGAMKVCLVDCRAGSGSEGVVQRLVLSGEEPSRLYIPAGVAHGYRAGPEGALLLYAMDQQFDLQNPNEGRLPWDLFGADLWDEDRG